jgi:predicted AlkP superfamily phosphohydrolase/phosphomutase
MLDRHRVLVIGLDGATWDVLDPWIEEGILPNLSHLRKNGSWGILKSTIPPITAAAWGTFATGKRPGKHGVFHFVPIFNPEENDTEPEIVNAKSLKSSAIWDILGHHDRKVILINIPMTYPPRQVNGTMITGLLTPKGAPVFTHPPELSKELSDYIIDLDRFIDEKPFATEPAADTIKPSIGLIEEFRMMMERRAITSLDMMRSNDWDFFMVVFTGTDRLGHYLWVYHNPPNEIESQEQHLLFKGIKDYYIQLDEIIGELLQTAGKDVTVLIMSDHGMGPDISKRVHGNNWLKSKGWLDIKPMVGGVNNVDRWLTKLGIPRDKVGRLILKIPGLASTNLVRQAAESHASTINEQKSTAYFKKIYNNFAGIYIDLPSEAKTELVNKIIQALTELVDPENGESVVENVITGTDYYHGPYAKNIPDLIIALKPDYGWGYQVSSYSSFVTKLPILSKRGDHRLEGIFLLHGPGVLAQAEPMQGMSIEDLSPTILYLMNLPQPEDMDGKVITEVFQPGTLEAMQIQVDKPIGFWPEENQVSFYEHKLSAEDEEGIRSRLQDLGYLD